VYKWDKVKKAYSGPAGEEGEHFRILNTADTGLIREIDLFGNKGVFREFDRLRSANLTFPMDPDFVAEPLRIDDPWVRWNLQKPSAKDVSKPYSYASLRSLTHEDTVLYMSKGKSMRDLEVEKILKTRIPTDFWALNPKAAALATANQNRYPDHQMRFRLALDDRDGRMPPDNCSVAFTDVSDNSYNAIERHYFIRVDPKSSYLAYARSWSGGIVYFNFVTDQPAFDLRYCELSYEEASHIAQTIWWLNRVRSSGAASDGIGAGLSSADGKGSLTVRNERGDVVFKLDATMRAGQVSERWRANYNPETCLNLSAFLIAGVLTDRLGDRWSRFEPKPSQDTRARRTDAPRYEQDERERTSGR
jgi:hypothetical protein